MVTGVSAQENSNNKDEYDRIGLTVYFFTYGSNYKKAIAKAVNTVSLPDRFDDNNLEIKTITIPSSWNINTDQYESISKEGGNDRIKVTEDFFTENAIGKKIIAKCYNYDPEKGFDLSTLFKRAEYNASDEEIKVASSSKRGMAQIRDYGHQLVNNSYVVVIDLQDITKETQREEYTYRISYKAQTGIYLYKVDFNEQKINDFFNYWVYDDDTDEVKQKKLAEFKSKYTVPIKYVHSDINSREAEGSSYGNPKNSNLDKNIVDDKAFSNLISDSYRKMLETLAKDLEVFQIETKVINSDPIQSKIGKKEDLKTDDKYFVYEYVWKDKSQSLVTKRRAVIRTKEVADNRNDNRSATSSFYTTYGGKVKEGMMIREKRDFGIAISGCYENKGLGGGNLQVRYRLGKNISIPAFYLLFEGGLSYEDYSDLNYTEDNYLSNFKKDTLSFTRFGIGLGKGFQFLHNFEFTPYVILGFNSSSKDDLNDYTYNTLYYKCGAAIGLNILQNLQLFGRVNYYGFGDVTVRNSNNDKVEDMGGEKWKDEFPDQEGAYFGFGLQFEF